MTVRRSAAFLLTVAGMRNDHLMNSIPRGLKNNRSLTGCLGPCYQRSCTAFRSSYTLIDWVPPEFPPSPPQRRFGMLEDRIRVSLAQCRFLCWLDHRLCGFSHDLTLRGANGYSRPRYILTQSVLPEADLGCSNNPFVNVQQEITPLPLSLIKSVRVASYLGF